jgi:hypothetical protein
MSLLKSCIRLFHKSAVLINYWLLRAPSLSLSWTYHNVQFQPHKTFPFSRPPRTHFSGTYWLPFYAHEDTPGLSTVVFLPSTSISNFQKPSSMLPEVADLQVSSLGIFSQRISGLVSRMVPLRREDLSLCRYVFTCAWKKSQNNPRAANSSVGYVESIYIKKNLQAIKRRTKEGKSWVIMSHNEAYSKTSSW